MSGRACREMRWAEEMRRGLAGDRAAYGRLLAEVAGVLRGLVRFRLARHGLSVHETEDVVQEVLLALHLKRATWDPDRPILPWIHAIARYKLIDAARRMRRGPLPASLPLEDWIETIAAPPAEPTLETASPERFLAALPAGQARIVRALAMEGASVRGTAERFGLSEGAVRVALHRGLARLRTLVLSGGGA